MAPENDQQEQSYFVMPNQLFGLTEIRHLQWELEHVDEFMTRAGTHERDKQAPLPKTSRLLETVVADNQMNLLLSDDRQRLVRFLHDVEAKAPVIHMSFASDPSAAFRAKIVDWLRANLHPYALLQVGLQPGIAAGCMVRINSRVFDLSLRNRFQSQRERLIQAIGGAKR